MRRRATLTCCLLAAACTGAVATPPRPWQQLMRGVARDLDQVGVELQRPGHGDLRQVAAAARAAAAAIATGYGEHELGDVPGFAAMSRDAETWLLQLALEANQGHGDLAHELYGQRQLRHCSRCHQLAEQHGHAIAAPLPKAP